MMKLAHRQAWHGPGADVQFEPADFEVIDLTLGQIPELRLCALALKRARALNLKYPVKNAKALTVLIGNKRFVGGGHKIRPADIGRFMPAEFFPLTNEGELVSRIYMALLRCREETALKLHLSRFTAKRQAPVMVAGTGGTR
jgi:hypothetical protein